MIPGKFQSFVEGIVRFVEESIAKPGIGHGYERYVPLLASFFLFISIGNLFEVIPFFQMPLNARMGPPLVFALTAWAMFISVGIKHHGGGYIKEVLFPPGVPKALYILITPIEFLSTFLVRPFSHAVRLFANMLAGHILLITFGVLSIATFEASALIVPVVRGLRRSDRLHGLRDRRQPHPGLRVRHPRRRVHRRRTAPLALAIVRHASSRSDNKCVASSG